MTQPRPFPWRAAAILCAAVSAFSGCAKEAAKPSTAGVPELTQRILPWVQVTHTRMTFDPHGTHYIVKEEKDNGACDLSLFSFPEGKKLTSLTTDGFPLLIEWRPGAQEVAYLIDFHGDRKYKLTLWNWKTGETRMIDTPPIGAADRTMTWTAAGDKLALCLGQKPDEIWALDLRSGETLRKLISAESFVDFEWSPDGTRLAAITEENKGEVLLWSEQQQTVTVVPVRPGENLQSLHWYPDSRHVAVTCRNPATTRYSLLKADTNGAPVALLGETEQRILANQVLGAEDVLVQAESGGQRRVWLKHGVEPFRPVAFDDGIVRVAAHDPVKRELLLEYVGLTEPRGFYRASLAGAGAPQLVFQPNKVGEFHRIKPQRVELTPRNGQGKPFHIQVWRTHQQPAKGAVIRFPLRHGANEELTFNGARQYILESGYDYIWFDLAIDNQPKGAPVTSADVPAGLAVVDYALRELKTPPEKLVLVGESTGSVYVGRTLMQLEQKVGGVVLRSLLKDFSRLSMGPNQFRIGLIQARNDNFCSPAEARTIVNGVFGENRMDDPRCVFLELRGEGHMPRTAESRAATAAVILKVLEGAP